jgi:hypothetical protein
MTGTKLALRVRLQLATAKVAVARAAARGSNPMNSFDDESPQKRATIAARDDGLATDVLGQ